MATTPLEVTPLTNATLNELVQSVDVHYDNGQVLKIENWVRLSKGNAEIYIGDNQLVITLINTTPENQSELEQFAIETQRNVMSYLIAEGFVIPNWIYVGLQNANSMFQPSANE